jgi:hypothetical protein
MKNQALRKGRPRGSRNRPLVERIAKALPRMQKELLRKALEGDIDAIKACHELVGEAKFTKTVDAHRGRKGNGKAPAKASS